MSLEEMWGELIATFIKLVFWVITTIVLVIVYFVR